MSVELETPEINLSEVFLDILSKGDMHLLKEFLDEQNISDVVELVNEFPENEATIVDNMTVHRAVSVFKILDINQQKDIIKELPARKTAKILNELPPDDRTDFLEELPKCAIRELIKLLDPE
jgi:magnesium transporter